MKYVAFVATMLVYFCCCKRMEWMRPETWSEHCEWFTYVFLWMKMICVKHDLLLCLAHMSHSIHLTRPKPSDSRIFMYVCDLLKNIVFDYEIVKMARYVMSKKWWWCHLVTGDREDMTRGRGLIQIILIQKKDVCLECSNHIFGWSFVITVITSFCTSQWCHKYLVPSSVTCEIACNNVP